MKKNTYSINIPYLFDPTHKGAPYTFNGGESYCNAGEASEIIVKACKGFTAEKDACTPYDKGSDIPELNASVKSSSATLVNKPLGYDFDSFKAHYFATVHSTLWIWAVVMDDTLSTYEMNAEEFAEFVDTWSTWASDRKVIRFKKTSGKMIKWLEEKVEG
jgi:hypothetical protein